MGTLEKTESSFEGELRILANLAMMPGQRYYRQ